MRKRLTIIYTMAFISLLTLSAQDEPDGFAAVGGQGLATTTGGEGGTTVHVSTLSDLEMYAVSDDPYIIIVNGLIESDPWTEIRVNSNKTIVGNGTDATLKNIELNLNNVENIIIRNLIIRDSYVEGDFVGKENDNDAIQADNSHHIWIDHCFFTNCGDGLIDLRMACDYVTVSYVHLSDHNKTFGLGWTDETDWRVTIHHTWFDSTRTRNPSFDQGIGHLYNNYLNDVEAYGNLSRGNARVVIENSFFNNVNDPLSISDNGKLYSSGNEFESCPGSKSGNVTEMPYDLNGYYDYTLDSTSQVRSIAITGTGPQANIANQYTGGTNPIHNLTASVAEGNGTVAADSASYEDGQRATITASPEVGWELDHWSVEEFGNTNPLTIVVTDSMDIKAYFTVATYRIVTWVENGQGSVEPGTNSYEYGEEITVTAEPDEGWVFDGWEGDHAGTNNPLSITVTEDMDVAARFVKDPATSTPSITMNNDQTISYYFNPANKSLVVEANNLQEFRLDLYSIDGKKAMSKELIQPINEVISLSGLKSGIYLVRFSGNGTTQTGRIAVY